MSADESPTNEKGQPGKEVSLGRAALSGLCPRCGESTLFEAPARLALSCSRCRLDYTQLERGGRLAGLVTLLVAAILIGIAMAVDVMFNPPFWLQAIIWAPLTVACVIGVLRFYKVALLYAQHEKQSEGGEK